MQIANAHFLYVLYGFMNITLNSKFQKAKLCLYIYFILLDNIITIFIFFYVLTNQYLALFILLFLKLII